MKKGMVGGIGMLAVGIFLIFWAETHSPKDFGQVVENAISKGGYTMSETWYYICLGLGILIGIVGVLKTFKSIK